MQNFSRVFDILRKIKERFGIICKINYNKTIKKEIESGHYKS